MQQIFIISKSTLGHVEYARLKQQIDEVWPKELPRPILLEGELELKVVDIAGSSNGRTPDFDSGNAGSTPAPASNKYTVCNCADCQRMRYRV